MNLRLTFAQFAFFLLAITENRLAAQPIITDFTPKVGTAGDTVTIIGSGFAVGNKLYFNSGVQAVISVTSQNQMMATVPSGITSGPLGVQQGTGQINYSVADYQAIGSGPYITDFSPTIAVTGDFLTINGVHFTGVAANGVKFNGTPSTDASVNSDGTLISVHVPSGATNGPISVTTSHGTSNSPTSLTVIGPGPYISDFSPIVGTHSTLVTINGRHFTNGKVFFNGVLLSGYVPTSDTLITVNPPSGVTTGPITITNTLGTYTTPTNFFVPPAITNFSPGIGQVGTIITITGQNLMGATTVTLGGISATFGIVDNSTIQLLAPSGAPSGLLRVTTPAGSSFSSSNFRMQPGITSFSPGFGSAGATVTIHGANLNEGLSSVKFNNVSATFGTPTASQVTATVPATTTGPITLTTTNGTVISANNFYFPASITSFSPNTGAPGVTTVSVMGRNFIDASAVTFNGAAAGFSINGSTNIMAVVPAGVPTGPIRVTTPAGTVASSNLFYAPPIINNFSPTHGLPAATVTIHGTNFLGATAVLFNGVNASGFTVVDNGSIQATVPASAQTGPITVAAPGGTNTSGSNFSLDYTSDLALYATASPSTVSLGSNFLFSTTVVNQGPNVAANVRITNTLPASMTLRAVSLGQGILVTNGNQLIASVGTVGVLGSVGLILTVTPTALGTFTNIATAVSDYTDPSLANNSASAEVLVRSVALLTIQRWPTNRMRISWPQDLSDYSLQFKASLPTNTWTPDPIPPSQTNNENVVLEPATNSARFYRLIK